MKIRYFLLFLAYCLWSLVCSSTSAQAGVKLKVSVSNPSALQEQKISIKSYLPKGIRPENVISAGGLEIGYDVKKGQCYVHKEIVLPAKEMAAYDVEIDDIWLINEDDLIRQRNYTYKLRDQLLKSEYADMAKSVTQEIELKIQSVLDKQEDNLVDKVTPIEHIGAYELNQETLVQIKEEIGILESMVMALFKGGASGSGGGGKNKPIQKSGQESASGKGKSIVGVVDSSQSSIQEAGAMNPQFGNMRTGSCLSQEAVKYANIQNVSLNPPENVKLSIEVENPSQAENLTVPVKYYLVEGVKVNDVIDSGGLDVGFDFEKSLYYVFKENILLQPAEKRSFGIELRNKWYIDKFYLFTLKAHADNLALALESRHFGTARLKNEEIQSRIDQLLKSQPSKELTQEYVAAFLADQQILSNIEGEIRGLEDMLVNSGAVEVMTPESKEKLCEEQRDKKSIMAQTGVEAIKEFKIVASDIFKGKAPDNRSTWQLICGIVIFLGLLSGIFYYTQMKEQKTTMLDPLTGAFSRAYVTERFREELRIAKNTKTKCSLLMMDIDKFKSINDTYGHAAGDIILKEFVIAVRSGIRATDLVGRLGGDEFIIILPTGDKERGLKIAEWVAKIVEKAAITVNKQQLHVTTSIGVSTYPDDSGTAEDMFNKADGALYKIKRRGGNGASAA